MVSQDLLDMIMKMKPAFLALVRRKVLPVIFRFIKTCFSWKEGGKYKTQHEDSIKTKQTKSQNSSYVVG